MLQLSSTLVKLVQPHTMAPVVLLLVNKGNPSQPQQAATAQVLVVLAVTTPDSLAQMAVVAEVALPLSVLQAPSLMYQ
jgi:hypothetical protein